MSSTPPPELGTTASDPDPAPGPDAGRGTERGARRQRHQRHQAGVLAIAAVAFFASAPGQSFLISVFVDGFLEGTGLSRTAFSTLYAAGTVVSGVSMLLLGRVVERAGVRTAWVVVGLVLAAACGLASLATGAVLVFVSLALLRTAGQGSFPLLGTLLVARSFGARRGRAMAVATLGFTGASVLLPPLVALLVVEVGWRASYQVLGLVVLVVVVPLALGVRPRPADDQAPAAVEAVPVAGYPAAVRITPGRWPDLPSAAATRLLLVLAAGPLIATALTFHAVSILGARGIGFVAAGSAVGLTGLTGILGLVAAGALLDRVSTRLALTVVSALLTVATLVLLVPSAAAAYVGFGVLGAAMGAVGVTNGTVWAREFGTDQLDRVQATAQSTSITSAALAPLVPALSLSLTGSYLAALVLLVGLAGVAMVLSLLPDPRPR